MDLRRATYGFLGVAAISGFLGGGILLTGLADYKRAPDPHTAYEARRRAFEDTLLPLAIANVCSLTSIGLAYAARRTM